MPLDMFTCGGFLLGFDALHILVLHDSDMTPMGTVYLLEKLARSKPRSFGKTR